MQEKSKKTFWQRLFGKKSCCGSFEVEEIKENKDVRQETKKPRCCCCSSEDSSKEK
jgi:hypothetical protein